MSTSTIANMSVPGTGVWVTERTPDPDVTNIQIEDALKAAGWLHPKSIQPIEQVDADGPADSYWLVDVPLARVIDAHANGELTHATGNFLFTLNFEVPTLDNVEVTVH